jgi:hypothetical protein
MAKYIINVLELQGKGKTIHKSGELVDESKLPAETINKLIVGKYITKITDATPPNADSVTDATPPNADSVTDATPPNADSVTDATKKRSSKVKK